MPPKTQLATNGSHQEALVDLKDNFQEYIRFIAERTYLQSMPGVLYEPHFEGQPGELDDRTFAKHLRSDTSAITPTVKTDPLKPIRDIHGITHALRVTAYTKILHNLKKEVLVENTEKQPIASDFANEAINNLGELFHMSGEDVIRLTQIAAFFHDSAREADGTDYWDHRSAENCFDFLKGLGIDAPAARFFALSARYKKDHDSTKEEASKTAFLKGLEGDLFKENQRLKKILNDPKGQDYLNYTRELIGLGDLLDVMRARDQVSGDRVYEFLNVTKDTNPIESNIKIADNLMEGVLYLVNSQNALHHGKCEVVYNNRTVCQAETTKPNPEIERNKMIIEFEQCQNPYALMEEKIKKEQEFLGKYLSVPLSPQATVDDQDNKEERRSATFTFRSGAPTPSIANEEAPTVEAPKGGDNEELPQVGDNEELPQVGDNAETKSARSQLDILGEEFKKFTKDLDTILKSCLQGLNGKIPQLDDQVDSPRRGSYLFENIGDPSSGIDQAKKKQVRQIKYRYPDPAGEPGASTEKSSAVDSEIIIAKVLSNQDESLEVEFPTEGDSSINEQQKECALEILKDFELPDTQDFTVNAMGFKAEDLMYILEEIDKHNLTDDKKILLYFECTDQFSPENIATIMAANIETHNENIRKIKKPDYSKLPIQRLQPLPKSPNGKDKVSRPTI